MTKVYTQQLLISGKKACINAKANVISGDITAAPIKYFSVGDLTHEEHIILESLGAHDSENHEGHH